ncbi:hypothetical protein Tco_1090342 [Tanacetum coccineum]|uniref:Reverse transcriptase domain-containing protein n=1 Tax=Tanacetum coccineum TaxID=301880 RepID=A0ABQ5I3W4_9ASTR
MANDRPMWGNNRAVALNLAAAIVPVELRDNFNMKGHHLSMIKYHQFNGRARADPHKHIAKFIKICRMFRYGNTNVDSFKLKLFPSSLFGEAKVCFTQHPNESLVEAWLRMKDLLCSCHGHSLGQGTITQIFYYGLDDATQAILDARGIFFYKTPNKAYQLLED